MRDPEASFKAADERQHHLGMTKTLEDVDRYQTVIEATKPEVIVETGTLLGLSAAWFAQFAPVITVDIGDLVTAITRNTLAGRVDFVRGSSIDPAVIKDVYALVAGRTALVSLDSNHMGDHVLAEMDAYHQLVPVGGYMVVEDGIVRQWRGWGSGPLEAIEAWLPEHPDWHIDTDVEDMHPVTLFPDGWLQRLP